MTLIEQMLAKEASLLAGAKEEEKPHTGIIHHPLTQALGYGALAGEGIHALMGMANPSGRLGFLRRAAHSPVGKGVGAGLIGGSSLFLGAEGAAALKDYLSRKTKGPTTPTPPTEAEETKLSFDFFDEIGKISTQAVIVESHPVLTKPWLKELGQSALKGGASAGLGAVVAYEATRMMNKLREADVEKEQKKKAKTVAGAAKAAKVPMVVKL